MSSVKTIFIAYHPGFLSYEKFKRKVLHITSAIESWSMVFVDDSNGFIDRFSNEQRVSSRNFESDEKVVEIVTHAIFFEDRDYFSEKIKKLFMHGLSIRVVNVNLTLVVNKDRGDAYDIYIGRGTVWGNPYQIGLDGDRSEVIRKYKYDFEKGFLKASDDFEKNISMLIGKKIACHCKPAACHGDVVAEYINSLDDGK